MPNLVHYLPTLILASGSIARKCMLQEQGIEVIVRPTDCDEDHHIVEPGEAVRHLAQRKLDAYRQLHPVYSLPVLCCDTLIWFHEQLIGKAKTRDLAKEQLQAFSGTTHEVHSGWALWYEGIILSGNDVASVTFKEIPLMAIEAYLDTAEWKGAAGSYRIQTDGRNLVASIEGDEATIIGLPVVQLQQALGQHTLR